MAFRTESEEAMGIKGRSSAKIVCWLLGYGNLIAWSCMLNVVDYYSAIFPRYHPTRVLTLIYQPFAFGTIAILTYHESKLNTRLRIIFGYTLFVICSLLQIVIDLITLGKGGIGAFICLCIISAAFGVGDAYIQGGMIGELSFMNPEFMQSFLAGIAASGALTSAVRLITKAVFERATDGLRKGALMFFAIALLFEILCVVLYAFVFPKLPIVKYYRAKAASEGSKTVSADLAAAGIQLENEKKEEEDPKDFRLRSLRQLVIENLDYELDLCLIYVLTLSIVPGFLSEDTGNHSLRSWYALVLISMYTAFDLIGRYPPMIKSLYIESRKWLMLAVLSRFLFVPAFYFIAKYGGQAWMIIVSSLLGLTNGYLTVCILTAAPSGYMGPEANALGNLMVLFCFGGILAGAALDWLWLIGKGW
ncbi:hypothetical protein HPP92_000774 [Vanilla planifolia]|uniref:Equilibrative nucleotide transporter 3 n=1 Tax=Vanilla planifolia TaxID=51239 RepID=A0A835SBT5_VANPL|nr:hypothetical protein HPP92_000916 [Vanilla planifolia]KAG0500702.1 hypothetical protein HPP92_000774 [Vanilla planifolia]